MSVRTITARWRIPINGFREHQEDSIRFGYRGFNWLLLNAVGLNVAA